MSNISDFATGPSEPTLEEMLQTENRRVALEMDPFHAARHNERTEVAARYLRDFFRTLCSPTEAIGLSKVVVLNPGAVANVVAWDLKPAGKEGVIDMLTDLVDHARQYLAERRSETAQIPPSLEKGLADFIQRNLAQHISHPIRSRITLDLAIHPAPATPPR